MLDIISPCVTFNDFDGSTKGWEWAKEHEEPLHEIGFVPRLPEIEVEQKAGQSDPRAAPRRLVDHAQGACGTRSTTSPTASRRSGSWTRASATTSSSPACSTSTPKRQDFVTMQNMTDTPLALLPDETLRPSEEVLAKIMETI